MTFIRQFNVELPFDFKKLRDLREVCWFCERPDAEFMDADVEALRRAMIEAAERFVAVMGHNTFPRQDSLNELPREWMDEQPKRYLAVVQEMLGAQRVMVECFDNFVRAGRRKLGIDYHRSKIGFNQSESTPDQEQTG